MSNPDNLLRVPVAAFQPFPWHKDILQKFDSGSYHTFMLNWHRRAMKTTMTINLLLREACTHPNRTYVYIAPTYKQGKMILWQDPEMLPRYIPNAYVRRKNETELFIEFKNGSYFRILGGDDPDSIRGTNAFGYVIDEWPVFTDAAIWSQIISPILTRKRSAGINAWAMFTFTPRGRNHAFEMWNECVEWKGWHRSLLTVDHSKLLTEEMLIEAKKQTKPESLFRQEYYCDFTSDDERVVISWQVVNDLKKNVLVNDDKRKFVVADPSLGGDACPIMCFEGSRVVKKKTLVDERNPMIVAGEIIAMMNSHGTRYCVIDANGLGEGIAARIEEQGYTVLTVRPQERVRKDTKYLNKRAEMIFYVLNEMLSHRVAPIEDEDIINQLTSVRYNPVDSSGKIKLEKKEETKKRIGRSPDDSDCYIMGIYELLNIPKIDYSQLEQWRNPNQLIRRKKAYAGNAKGY